MQIGNSERGAFMESIKFLICVLSLFARTRSAINFVGAVCGKNARYVRMKGDFYNCRRCVLLKCENRGLSQDPNKRLR